MKLRNLTPHVLNLLAENGQETVLEPAGPAPRLTVAREPLGSIAGLPIVRSTMGAPDGLPAPEVGVVLVVSALVAEAAADRDDLAYPGEAVRDGSGRIIGARGLCAGMGLAARLRSGGVL